MENLAPIPRHRSWYGTLRQNVIVFLLLFIGLSANAAGNKVTLDVNNVTLENVLHSIEQQTSYRFFYSKETVNVDVPVSIKVQDEAVPDVLNKLLPKLNIGYVIDKQQIALNNVRPKGNDTEKSKNQTVKITGTVTDHQGDPLIGVSIIGNNGSGGVTTDIDGKYSIEVPPGQWDYKLSIVLIRHLIRKRSGSVPYLYSYRFQCSSAMWDMTESKITYFSAIIQHFQR